MKFRRRAGGAAREEVYLNLTSLIDVIFVLLLFFVVTTIHKQVNLFLSIRQIFTKRQRIML